MKLGSSLWHNYRPQTKLLEDNVFINVSQSFCPHWGSSIPQCNGAGGLIHPITQWGMRVHPSDNAKGQGVLPGRCIWACIQEGASNECASGVHPGVHPEWGVHAWMQLPNQQYVPPLKDRWSVRFLLKYILVTVSWMILKLSQLSENIFLQMSVIRFWRRRSML